MIGTEIRHVETADARALATLMSELGYPTEANEMNERLRRVFSDPNYDALVAVRGTEVLGMAGICLGHYFERSADYCRLLALVVSAEERHKGIGRLLLLAVKDWARKRGVHDIVVTSGTHRADAHRFYEASGYKLTGHRFVKLIVDGKKRISEPNR